MVQSLLDKNLAFLIKLNIYVFDSAFLFIVIYTKEMEIYVDKHMSSLGVPIKKMDKQTVLYSYNGILFSNIKEKITNICNNTYETK